MPGAGPCLCRLLADLLLISLACQAHGSANTEPPDGGAVAWGSESRGLGLQAERGGKCSSFGSWPVPGHQHIETALVSPWLHVPVAQEPPALGRVQFLPVLAHDLIGWLVPGPGRV